MQEQTIFDFLYDKYKITNKVRLIELFAGIGSQAKALKNIGADFEHYKVVEFDKYAIASYNAIHNTNFETLDITQIDGKDLEIVDTDKFTYLMTYSFPCITKDSLILTKKGYIPIENISVGDYVLTKSNTWQRVVKKFDNGKHQTYFLNAMGFENIHCTGNHKFYVREMTRKWNNVSRRYERFFKKPDFKEAKDLTNKDYFGVPVLKEEIPFYTNDLDFWFMIGMYLGDGWLSNRGNDVIISCNAKKLELLKEKLPQDKWHYTINKGRTCYRFRFSNKEVYQFIKQHIGTGCENKNISNEIMCLPKKQLREFYNGYLYSDGCIIRENVHQFSTINKSIAYSISIIINKLFNRPTCIYKNVVKPTKIIENRVVNQKNWYMIRFKTISSKNDKAFYENGYIWYPFKKLEKAEIENVYNMEVENDHSYILQGSISKNCQDLSLAGKRKGMKDTSTRSGLLWQVERILNESKELPQILLMENVPMVHSKDNIQDFQKWILALEKLGYKSYWNDLNAKDFGIPQNRNRTFMISILGDYNYNFPKKQKLKLRLKDMSEDQVDEKYYLSKKMLNFIMDNLKKDTQNYIEWEEKGKLDIDCRAWKENCIAPTTTTAVKTKILQNDLRIRKLTPKECFRLMGFSDEDFEKASKVNSNTQLYKQAGNSIVVNVLEAIFKELFQKEKNRCFLIYYFI